MPTAAEVPEQLTRPGHMFEITTHAVDGVQIFLSGEPLPDLRSIRQLPVVRGEAEVGSEGTR